jgi:hypothetical protein
LNWINNSFIPVFVFEQSNKNCKWNQ